MLLATERLMARRQIAELIRRDATVIHIQRKVKIPNTETGGWVWGDPVTLPPQTVAFIPFKRRMTEYMVDTQYGNVPDLPYVVIGSPELDIAIGDTFIVDDECFEVKELDIKREVRIAAQVDYYGRPEDGSG